MTHPAIEVSRLEHSYGTFRAVRDVSFSVAPGEVFCLLGPNGAGKTTITEILEGYRDRTSGDVRVLGHDPRDQDRELREQIGIVLQETGIQGELTVAELIEMYRGWYRNGSRRSTQELLDLVALDARQTARAGELSGGQRRRLDLALALVGDPDILFLDEPTTGFDPEARRRAWQTLKDLTDTGTTIFLTTHFMDEAQALADRVAVINHGEIVALEHPDDLGGRRSAPAEIRYTDRAGASRLVRTDDPVRALHELTTRALADGDALDGLTVTRPTLEDVYLELTKEQA